MTYSQLESLYTTSQYDQLAGAATEFQQNMHIAQDALNLDTNRAFGSVQLEVNYDKENKPLASDNIRESAYLHMVTLYGLNDIRVETGAAKATVPAFVNHQIPAYSSVMYRPSEDTLTLRQPHRPGDENSGPLLTEITNGETAYLATEYSIGEGQVCVRSGLVRKMGEFGVIKDDSIKQSSAKIPHNIMLPRLKVFTNTLNAAAEVLRLASQKSPNVRSTTHKFDAPF